MNKHRRSSYKKEDTEPTSLPTIRPNVAGIDIGSTEHWVCVPPGPTESPTFACSARSPTSSSNWSPAARAGGGVGGHAEHVRLLDPALRASRIARHPSRAGQRPAATQRPWPQDRLSRLPVDPAFAQLWPAARVLPARRRDRGCTSHPAPVGQFRRAADPMPAVDAESVGPDERAGPPCRHRYHRHHRYGDCPCHRRRRARPGPTRRASSLPLQEVRSGDRQYLTGTWRQEHLFNLASALRLYEPSRTGRLSRGTLARGNRGHAASGTADEPVPAHPNPNKEKELRNRGQQLARTAFWRLTGIDLTRIDGIRGGAAKVIITEVGPNLSAFPSERHFVSWLRLCPSASGRRRVPRRSPIPS